MTAAYKNSNNDGDSVIQKIQKAFAHPDRILPFVKTKVKKFIQNVYIAYVRVFHNSSIQKSVQGSLMELDVSDEGISRDLATWGIREAKTTKAYQREIKKIGRNANRTVNVIDIGANIGYYAFMPLSLLDDVQVIAIEVDDKNIQQLKRNIELNDFSNKISIHNCAVGATSETAELHRSTHSNRHSMQQEFKDNKSDIITETVDTKVRTLDDIVEEEIGNHKGINIIRMDVEGYEAKIFKGMDKIFRHNDSLLLQIEIHPNLLSGSELEYLISKLDKEEFKIISAIHKDRTLNISSWDNICKWGFVELILKSTKTD